MEANGRREVPLPTVSVVIPTLGRRDGVLHCVEAVLRQHPAEVIVVVNGADGGDTLAELTRRARGEARLRTLLVEQADQFAALQRGIEESVSDVVLCIDDDVMAEDGLVAGHARHHADRDGLLVLGYMPVLLAGRRRRGQAATYVYSGVYEWLCAEYERDHARVLEDLWAGNVSMRRTDALAIGFASDDRLGFHADKEFGMRCKRAGLDAVFDRTLLARHHYTRSLEQLFGEGRTRARSRVMIAALHPDAVGPDFLYRYGENLPAPARWVVRLGRTRTGASLALGAIRAVLWSAGVIRWWKLESLAADVALNVVEVDETTRLLTRDRSRKITK